MKDWIVWIIQGLVVVLMIVNWFWVKRFITRQDDREKEWEKEGGLVTRNLYFAWCKDQQMKCPACGAYKMLENWRNGMVTTGGPLTKGEHTALCKEVMEVFGDKLCQEFEHHRTLMASELKLIRTEIALVKSDISKDVLQTMTKVKDELLEEMAEVERRSQ